MRTDKSADERAKSAERIARANEIDARADARAVAKNVVDRNNIGSRGKGHWHSMNERK